MSSQKPQKLNVDLSQFKLPKKSFWKDRTTRIWSFYCPLCGIARRIPYQARPGLKHMAQIGLTATIVMMLTWSWFDWKGIISFLPLWVLFEMIYRTKVRAAVACDHCGFDPYLYMIDVPRAREVVENHWRKKFAEKGIPYPEKSQSTAGAKSGVTKAPEALSADPAKKPEPQMVT